MVFPRLKTTARLTLALATMLAGPYSTAIPIGGSIESSVSEFVNQETGRRFLSGDAAEIKVLLSGTVGQGWIPSGLEFSFSIASRSGLKDVCRFYAPSINTHFYTLNDLECTLLRDNTLGWRYEGIAFRALDPAGGICPVAVRRFYKHPVHQYVADESKQSRLRTEGWIDEGVAFCASAASTRPIESHAVSGQDVALESNCPAALAKPADCIELHRLPSMPFWYDPSPTAPANWPSPSSRTSVTGPLRSPVGGRYPDDVLAHSFVQFSPAGRYGIYLHSRDFIADPRFPQFASVSIRPTRRFDLREPSEGESDHRIMPWRGIFPQRIVLGTGLQGAIVRRDWPEAHIVVVPFVELHDTSSKRRLMVTASALQTFQASSRPEEDYNALDVTTGVPIVSTTFRSNPAFGTVTGKTVVCAPTLIAASCLTVNDVPYWSMSLRKNDIEKVLSIARRLDPRLSSKPEDYAIARFGINNEVVNSAELGLGQTVSLDLYLDER